MPCSVYRLLLKDPDCTKLTPSDLQLGTYTNNKVKLIGAWELYVVHPAIKSIEPVTFFVTHNEGSVLISCTTNLALGLIEPHVSSDQLPSGSNIISSSADQPRNSKPQLNVYMLMEASITSKLTTNPKKISDVCSKKEQSQLIPKSNEYQVNQCMEVPVQDETRKWEYQTNVKRGGKNCQETPNVKKGASEASK